MSQSFEKNNTMEEQRPTSPRLSKLRKAKGTLRPLKPLRKKKEEEWHEVQTSVRLEFWEECKINKGPYHHAFALKGWRHSMEDTMDSKSSITPELPNLFGVYDGHGGQSCAHFCKDKLLENLAERPDLKNSAKMALADAFLSIDTEYGSSEGNDPDAGATATVLVIQQVNEKKALIEAKKSARLSVRAQTKAARKSHKARADMLMRLASLVDDTEPSLRFYCACVGDSRGILIHSSGKVEAISNDHNLERKDEFDRITAGKGEIRHDPEFDEMLVYSSEVERGLGVTRSIGDKAFKPLVTAFPEVIDGDVPNDGAYFLLASDGLWAKVTNEEAGRIMLDYGLVSGLRNLANLANKRESTDNITVMAIDIQKMISAMQDS